MSPLLAQSFPHRQGQGDRLYLHLRLPQWESWGNHPSSAMQSPPPEPPICPTNCPNRIPSTARLIILGRPVTPLDVVLQAAIVLILVVPAVKASAKEDFELAQAMTWVSAIGAACTVVHLSPTDRLGSFLKLSGK